MRLNLTRFSTGENDTLGILHVDDMFECFTLENTYWQYKIPGKTRIPSGIYNIKFRTEGGHHQRYSDKFGGSHHGMLELQDVPDFRYILIHIGNTHKDTAGCILPGRIAESNKGKNGFVGHSTEAYKALYSKVARELMKDNIVTIEIKDTYDG